MGTLILSQREIRRLLPMDACMEVIADAARCLCEGRGQNPLRTGLRLQDGSGLIGTMPGALDSPHALGLKVITVFPDNHGTHWDAHQGVVVLFEREHGRPVAIMEASEITAIRTGAASGVATHVLAREDAGDLAILGAGVQAWSHLQAMACARTLRRVRVFSPRQESREAFAARASDHFGMEVEPTATAEDAVRGADLVCTTTNSSSPVLSGDWLEPGAHVNAAGASVRAARELDTHAVQRSRLYVDRRESTVNEAGDYLIPLDEDAITEDHIVAEIGDVLLGREPGRQNDQEITVYKSLGIAAWDLAAGMYVLGRARAEGLGTEVELGGVKESFDGPDSSL